jgi:FeS assembly SUF system regulator
MLRVSKLTDYGTVVLAQMAREPGRTFSALSLADEVVLPPSTVRKLLKVLTRQGLLHSSRGQHGGYRLAQPPGDISLADVIEALEGPMGLIECSREAGLCPLEPRCTVRQGWQGVNGAIDRMLRQVSLLELIDNTQGARRITLLNA